MICQEERFLDGSYLRILTFNNLNIPGYKVFDIIGIIGIIDDKSLIPLIPLISLIA